MLDLADTVTQPGSLTYEVSDYPSIIFFKGVILVYST